MRRTTFGNHNDPINMKSQDYEDSDDDYLDDPIHLNFGENPPSLENLQFLEPGIIDLDCDSEEDCKYVDEDTTDINHPGGASSLQPVTTINSVIINPMCIKLIDCYKFPWYFDQPTKDIIENKLVNNSVNVNISGQIMDVCSKELRNISHKCLSKTVDNNTLNNGVNNNVSDQIIEINSSQFRNETDKRTNNEIDIMNRVHEMFSTRVVDPVKRMASNKKRNDLELLKAISQRNKTGIDLKKNKGLVGMKIQRIVTETQTMEMRNKPETQKERNEQNTLNKFYVQAVDKALINIGTTITPVFEKTLKNINESGLSKSKSEDVKTDLDSITCNLKISAKKDVNNEDDLEDILACKDINGEDTSIRINETTKVAEEIVRIICHSKDTHKPSGKRKPCKAMPLSKKRENEHKAMIIEKNKATLKQQRYTEGSKMTKMITPIPLSSKARNKEKRESFKQSKIKVDGAKEQISEILYYPIFPKKITMDINDANTESRDAKNAKHGTENLQYPKAISAKPAFLLQNSDDKIPKKSYKTLNRYTKNILNKIQAKHLLRLSKISKADKFHKKHSKNMVNYDDQPNSIDKGKLTPILSNVTKQDSSTHSLDSPKANESHPDNHLQFPHHIATNTLPLNTIIMKTAQTDDAKIEEANNRFFVEKSHSNGTLRNNTVMQSNTEQLSTSKRNRMKESRTQSIKVSPLENITGFMENKGKPMHVAQVSPTNNAFQMSKDKYTIQTIITGRNEYAEQHNSTYTANNINDHTHVPKPQDSAIIIRPTETQNHQAQVKKKPLTVHNSMQSHILYRPQGENRSPQMYPNNPEALQYQAPIQQTNQAINQQPVNSVWYPVLYAEGKAPNMATVRSPSEFRADISKLSMNNRTMPSVINGAISAQTGVNARPLGDIGGITQMGMNARPMIPDTSKHFSPQMGMNLPPRMISVISPHKSISNRPIPPVVNTIRSQMGSYVRPPRVHAGVSPQMTNNYRPPGACDIQPGKIFWSYAFPPPIPPPPPPPLPPSFRETTRFIFTEQATDSSIIGRNNDGIIKKINITNPVADHNPVDIKDGKVKVENIELGSTPLSDELLESQPAITKLEMLLVLDTSVQQMQSPVQHLQNTFSISPSQSPAENLKELLPIKTKDLNNSQPLQSNEKLIYLSNHKLPQDILPTKPIHNFKVTMPILPNVRNTTNSKVVSSYKSTFDESLTNCEAKQSSVTNSTRFQTFDDGTRSTKSAKRVNESNLSQVIHSKAPMMKNVELSASNNKSNYEENNKVIYAKKTGTISPVKRAMPFNEVKNASTAKYKPGPLSKKRKFNDSRPSTNETKIKEQMIVVPSKRYSSPILPIPTFEKVMSEITAPSKKRFDRPVEASKKLFDIVDTKTKKKVNNTNPNKTRKRKQFEQERIKVDSSNKISLDEYKKRSVRRPDEEAKAFMNTQKDPYRNTIDMHRRASNVDSDLGYDSDVTVKL